MKKKLSKLVILIIFVCSLIPAGGNTYAARVMTPDQMKNELTEQDIKEATPYQKKADNTDDIGMPITGEAPKEVKPAAGYPNVNNYIIQKNFQHPNIVKELHKFSMFSYGTKDKLPTGIVIHYTANPNNFSARSEANYQINGGWKSAFVHTFIDAGTILNIHDTNYGAWGCGPVGNKYFVQFEMVTARNFDDFAKTTSYSAWYTAYLLRQYDLAPSLAQANRGVGTVWTHHNVTTYLGGTDHTDPTAYFAKYGYDINQFYSLVKRYYDNFTRETVVSRETIDKDGSVVGKKAEYYLTDKGIVPADKTTDNLVNKDVKVTQLIKTSLGKQYYLATVNGKQVAWIPVNAFKEYEKVIEKKDVDKKGIVLANQLEYWLKTYGIESANQKTDKNLLNKEVRVTSWVKTSKGNEYYLATVNGKQVAWIRTNAFREYETVVERQSVDKKGVVVSNQPEYWLKNTGIEPANKTTSKNLVNKKVRVTQLIKTSTNNQYYLATVDGKQVAWIPVNAFKEFETVLDTETVYKAGKVLKNHAEYYLTSDGIEFSNKKTDSNLINKDVRATKLVTTSLGNQYYLATINRKQIAWIPIKAWENQGFNIIRINYLPGYGINAVDQNGKQIKGTNSKFKHGTGWKTSKVVAINGKAAYQVSSTEFIPSEYTEHKSVIEISAEGTGVQAVDTNGQRISKSEQKFKNGTKWKYSKIVKINDGYYFKVSNTEYIPTFNTVGGGYKG